MGRHQSKSRSRDRHKHKSHKHKQHKQDRHKQHKHKSKHHKRSSSPQQRGKYYVQKIDIKTIVKQLPCWEPSGILLEYYNAREGVALKFHEPAEAMIPTDRWRIYPFKGEESLNPILLQNQSCYLIGKDQRVCDILLEHPTVSRQHCVLQFRQIKSLTLQGYQQEIRPYLMDLDSSNGTFLNGQKIQGSRYVQILPDDRITFGLGKQQFVMVLQQ